MSHLFFDRTGKMAIGSRLRLLATKVTEDAAAIYQLYGNDMQPKWFPVLYVLEEGGEKSVTAIATEIGHSQPSVSKILREMGAAGLVKEEKHSEDARRTVSTLTHKGTALANNLHQQYKDVDAAIEGIMAETEHNLWKAMEEWERLLAQQSLLERVKAHRQLAGGAEVSIVEYTPKYQQAFRRLNEEWISTYFKMEAADYKALDNPEGYIIDKGGSILVALYAGKPVGVCALIKMEDDVYDYELAKMAVSPQVQGKRIGWLLGQAVVEKAKTLGAKAVYLETNSILQPAVQLYRKLGFQQIHGRPSPYERCNVQMELVLTGRN